MNIKKLLWMNFCLLIICLSAYSQDSTKVVTLSLKEAVDIALKNSLEIKQTDLLSQRAGVNFKQSKWDLVPNLNGAVNHSSNQGRSIDNFTNTYIDQTAQFADYSLSSGVALFNGFALMNSLKQNSLAFDASKKELQQAKDNLTINVILTYLQILQNQDQLTQAENQLNVTKQQVERLEIMNRDGAIAPSLLFDLKGQMAGDELSVINGRNSLESSKLTLSQQMNVPYDKAMQVERLTAEQMPVSYEGDVDKIYQIAAEQLSLVKAAELRTESADRGVKAARGTLYPSLRLSGGINTNYSSVASRSVFLNSSDVPNGDYVNFGSGKVPVFTTRDNFRSEKIGYTDQLKNNYSTSIRLGLSIPLLNSFVARNRIALAKIDLKNAQYVEENTKIRLKQLIEQAYFNMTAALSRYQASVQQVAAFQESFRAAEVRFNAGASTSVEYLNSKNFLDRANINLIIARYDYILRTKVLDYYQAKPLW